MNLEAFAMALTPYLLYILIWDAVWKGMALWKSGRKNQLTWFVCLFIFNTVGILPIVYLIFSQKGKKLFDKKKKHKKKK